MKIPIQGGDDDQVAEDQQAAVPETPGATTDMPEAATAPPPQDAVPVELRLQAVEAALAKKTQEYDELRNQLLRLTADFDNDRKRLRRQCEDAKQFATSELVLDLLPGLDNLERALIAARQDPTANGAQIAEGVGMVLKQLKEALAKVGVRDLQACGQPFDPMQHEAVGMMAVEPEQDGVILEEVQRGYVMHDRLLRAAKVVVGKAPRETGHGRA